MNTDGFRKQKTAALVLAAGKGTRFGSEKPKQFLLLDEVPMMLYSIDALLPLVDRLLLVTSEEDIPEAERILDDAGLLSNVPVIAGGATRIESTLAGLQALTEDGDYDFVLIHDAARALLTEDVVRRVIQGVKEHGAVSAAVLSVNTVKVVSGEGRILETPDRKTLMDAQTPQAFRMDWILEAAGKAVESGDFSGLTDDASMLEKFTDHPVFTVPGSEENFKITTPLDFLLAETLVTARRLKKEAEEGSKKQS